MRIELISARQVGKRLRRAIEGHSDIHWSVAWGYNGDAADILLANRDKFKAVTFGIAFSQTDPDLIDRLVGVKNAFVAEYGDGTFHPKIYYFQTGDMAEAIVGSSNFTNGGLGRNWEACVHIEGDADDVVFRQIRSNIEDGAPFRKPVTAKFAAAYRRQHDIAARLPKPARNPGMPSDRKQWRQLDSALVSMSWLEYQRRAKRDKFHSYEKRLAILRKAQELLSGVSTFLDLTDNQRKAIGGVVGQYQRQQDGLDGHEWGWFGSMGGMGDFANRIAEKDRWLADAIDQIPRHGDVPEASYRAFCKSFRKAFDRSTRIGGVPTATRLLAMKRPDTFVCVCQPNLNGIAKALDFPRTTLDLDNYWQRIVANVRLSSWYNAERPRGRDAELWDGRVAMLDAIYYRPR